MSKIFITGAAGCIGSNLTKRLSEDSDNDIKILLQGNTWHPFLNNLNLDIHYGDIRNKQQVLKAMHGCDEVYQVAGVVSYNKIDDIDVYSTHVDGVRNILEAAKEIGVKKVVVTASTAGIGIPIKKETPLNEESPFDLKRYKKVMYMYSKHLCIELCKEFAKNGLNVSIISPTTVYGQGDITMHIGKVVKKIKENKIKYAPPGGNSVVSIDDIIDAHILVMERGKTGENYIFANEFMSYLEMFNRIAKLIKAPQINRTLPLWSLPPTKSLFLIIERVMFPFDKKPILSPSSLNFSFKHRHFDSTKSRNELNWRPSVDFDMAMVKAIDFYREYNLI